jgi:hypothetical protein
MELYGGGCRSDSVRDYVVFICHQKRCALESYQRVYIYQLFSVIPLNLKVQTQLLRCHTWILFELTKSTSE